MTPGILYSVDEVSVKALRKGDHTYEVYKQDHYIGAVHRVKTRHYEVHGTKFDKLYTAVAYVVRKWMEHNE